MDLSLILFSVLFNVQSNEIKKISADIGSIVSNNLEVLFYWDLKFQALLRLSVHIINCSHFVCKLDVNIFNLKIKYVAKNNIQIQIKN